MPKWDRVCELWCDSFSAWRRAVIDEPPRHSSPPWAARGEHPFMAPYAGFAAAFVLERPTDEFLRDARGYS